VHSLLSGASPLMLSYVGSGTCQKYLGTASARTATTPGGPCGLARPAPRLVLPVGSDRLCASKCHCLYPVLGCRRVVARRCVAGPASGPSPRCSAAPRSMPPCRCIASICHHSVLARCSALCVSAHVPCNVLHRSVQHTLRAQIYQHLIAGRPETGPLVMYEPSQKGSQHPPRMVKASRSYLSGQRRPRILRTCIPRAHAYRRHLTRVN